MSYQGVDGSTYRSVEDIPHDMPVLTAFPGYYVTKEGKGYSSGRGVPRPRRIMLYGVTLGLLIPEKGSNGTLCFKAWSKGERTRQQWHIVMLETFVGPRPEGHVAHHLDGDRTNNRLDNLTYKISDPNGRQTLTKEQVLEIASKPREISHREIAKDYNVRENVICAIRRGRRWGYLLKQHGIAFHKDEDIRHRQGFVFEGVDGSTYSSIAEIPDDMPVLTDYSGLYVDKKGVCYSLRSSQSKKRIVRYGVSLLPRKCALSKMGYWFFSYYDLKAHRNRPIYIHQLVLKTFVGPCPEDMEIRHLDGNSQNNHLNNLKYGTRSENRIDSLDHGTHVTQKLREEDVLDILAQPNHITHIALAEKYGVVPATIAKVRNGFTWKHVRARHGIFIAPIDGRKVRSFRKISEEKRSEIYDSKEHAAVLAEKLGLHRGTVDRIRREAIIENQGRS